MKLLKNKKVLIGISGLFVVVLIAVTSVLFLLFENSDSIALNNKINDNIINNNFLTIMLEQDDGTYKETTTSEWPGDDYLFNKSASGCQNGGELIWDADNNIVKMSGVSSDNCFAYFNLKKTLADYIKNNVYIADGINDLYYHDGEGNYENANQEAGDNSYRYSGANPNNYICFGSDEATCPNENLYRIIGVFGDEVKLIKSTSYGNYSRDTGNSNVWSTSSMKSTLNSTYLNLFSSTWTDLISTHSWKVGGTSYDTNYTVKDYFDREIGSSSSSLSDNAKVGLMYVSDYGYSASSDSWYTSMANYNNVASDNWMYLGTNEWVISLTTNYGNLSFGINFSGYMIGLCGATDVYSTRPSFYLNSDVLYVSGDGTQEAPYRIL